MSRSRHPQCSGGRGCWVCGDAGEVRRDREADAQRADEREDPNPSDTIQTDDAIARADEPCGVSTYCDRERCAKWRPCTPCTLEMMRAEPIGVDKVGKMIGWVKP